MKFLANPDKCISTIGFCVMVGMMIFAYMILNQFWYLAILLLAWIGFSVYLSKRSYVQYTISEDTISIGCMGAKYEIRFEEIDYIIETSKLHRVLTARYEIKVQNAKNIPARCLAIENYTFTKWLSNHREKFKIKTQVVLD